MAGRHNGNGHDRHDARHATETPDVSHIKNVDVTHEASDVNISGILKFVMGLTVLGVVVFVLMWGMFRLLNAQEAEKEPPAGPMAMTEEERLPPPPRLQAARGFGVKLENGEWVDLEKREPEAEYRVLREQWERRLNCQSGEESPATSPNCVPIDEAMKKLLEGGGVPVRTSTRDSGTRGVAPPTAWSSGRVSGKAGQ
ncbi:MAG TPA: hypothetical protein VE977_01720 [Pyrinomonadaceae bacterium]|nr:hypothetical protein [Pyrinomonadaceae bacterium]